MWLMPLLEWFSFFLGTTILTLRIVALYSGHTYVVRFIYCFLCLTWMGTLVAIFHTVHAATQTIKYSNFLHTCATTGRSPAIAWVFITPAIYEFTLFALTLVRAVRDARSKIITTDKRTPFLFIIYRDGFYYFGAIFGVHVWNAYLCATQPMAGVFMGIHFAWGLMSVMTCRIYLNLVQAANRGTETDFVSNIAISTHLGFKTHGTRGTKDRMAVGQGRQGGSVPLTTLNGSTTFGSVAPNRQRSNNPYL
ncbi:hypothetical protein FRC18_003393 [Serendipita sp. 400]|nr:hypothetical protein FRC18_003393 [Serendipita sp. 400]